MKTAQFILFKNAGAVSYQGKSFPIAANHLVVTYDDAIASTPHRTDWVNVFCYPGDLIPLSHEIVDLLEDEHDTQFTQAPVKQLPLFDEMIGVVDQLAKVNRQVLLKFIYVYCLGMDRKYFSHLFRYQVANSNSFFCFLENHFLNPWPVSRYATELGVPVGQLNTLFYKNFGMSAKQWLLEQRLKHARGLLLSTNKRVVDIAMECGFSNHSHFSDAFKKRYHCCPLKLRASLG